MLYLGVRDKALTVAAAVVVAVVAVESKVLAFLGPQPGFFGSPLKNIASFWSRWLLMAQRL